MKKKRKKWKLDYQSKFLIQLSQLLEKGYTVSQGLEFLQLQLPGHLQDDITECLIHLRKGDSLHTAFLAIGFHRDVLSYLYFAERHGDVQTALREGGNILKEKVNHIKKFKKLVQYPVMLLFFILTILLILSTVLLPQFEALYDSLGHRQSNTIITFISLIRLFPYILPVCICFFLILYTIHSGYFQKLSPEKKMNILLKIPVVKKVIIFFNSYFFSVHMSNLLKGGLSIYECFQLFRQQTHYPFFQVEAAHFMEKLTDGIQLDTILFKRKYYDVNLASVIMHGQHNGNLEQELFDYSLFMLEKMEDIIARTLQFIQPFLFSFIGIVILMMYMGVMLPMFEVMSNL